MCVRKKSQEKKGKQILGRGLAAMPGQTFLGHRKGAPAQGGEWQHSGGTWAASAWGWHSRVRGHICGVHAVKIPKILPGRGRNRLTANAHPGRGRAQLASAPGHTLQVDCQPISSQTWNLGQKWGYIFQVKRCKMMPQLFHSLFFQEE